MAYCASRFHTVRRPTREVLVGGVAVGGRNPVRVQSMTTSDTQDVAATVRQSIALAEAGCEIVRVTAPNVQAARCLKDIRTGLTAAGWGSVPLVADIHFLPQAAMEAVEHVEKVRVNPGNFADKKRFAVRDYTDADYELELERLHEAFTPLVKRSKELGRAMRIGTNHGSLSDRIMNRYGDTPAGMVESALEFLRIAESHSYKDIVLSMKSSNPKVMIEAYRLLVERMNAEDMHYPLHLGVTEAGDGEDGRIKGSIGIGSLLLDGLGDTIRVSLTEDSVYEIPVARAIADKAMSLWRSDVSAETAGPDSIDPFHFERRQAAALQLGSVPVGPEHPPRVIVRISGASQASAAVKELSSHRMKDIPAEGLLVPVANAGDMETLERELADAPASPGFLALELARPLAPSDLEALLASAKAKILSGEGIWRLRGSGARNVGGPGKSDRAFPGRRRVSVRIRGAQWKAGPPRRRPAGRHLFRSIAARIGPSGRRLPQDCPDPQGGREPHAGLDPQHRRHGRPGGQHVPVAPDGGQLSHGEPPLRRPRRPGEH